MTRKFYVQAACATKSSSNFLPPKISNKFVQNLLKIAKLLTEKKSVSDKAFDEQNNLLRRGLQETDNTNRLSRLIAKREKLNNFLVDDKHKYIYCYVPKV